MPHDLSLTRTVQDVPYLALPRLRLPGETGGAVTDPDELFDGWWDRVESIAGRCALNTTWAPRDPTFPYAERWEAAYDGIISEVIDNGWPRGDETARRLFVAGGNAIARTYHENSKHLKYWSYWYGTPGIKDPIGETVTDKIGIQQLTREFTEKEWSAVWAMAEVQKWEGGHAEAAALLGIPRAVLSGRLELARKRARALWVAPGDTPPPRMWHSARRPGAYHSRQDKWVIRRTEVAKRNGRREQLAEAVKGGTAKVADVETLAALTGHRVTASTIRQWIKDGDLVQRGIVERRQAYSVDEFVRVAISRGRLGADPRKQAA